MCKYEKKKKIVFGLASLRYKDAKKKQKKTMPIGVRGTTLH